MIAGGWDVVNYRARLSRSSGLLPPDSVQDCALMEADDLAALQEELHRLGNLHDARVTEIERSSTSGEVVVHVDDLHSNFLGLDSYPGAPTPGRLTARGVKDAAAALVVPDDACGIDEVTVNLASAGVDLHVRFWPAGDLRIACESVILEESGRRDLP